MSAISPSTAFGGQVVISAAGYAAYFRAPDSAPLAPGTYEQAERSVVASPGHPGLDVFGDGRGCNALSGRFVVIEGPTYDTDGTTLLTFAVDFEQHCEGGVPALYGSVRYHSSQPVQLIRVTGTGTFPDTPVGSSSPTQVFSVTDVGTTPVTVATTGFDSLDPGDFAIVADACTGTTLAVGDTCTIGVQFRPVDVGSRRARLRLDADTALGQHGYPLAGTALPAPPPDTDVDAVNVGVSTSTFYPPKDGSRDTVSIRGTLNETGTVSIAIYSTKTGHRVLLKSLGTKIGAYAFAWGGRSTSGTLQPAGKYRVVQTIVDALGHTRSWTSYATISTKRLYLHTATLTRSGSSIVARGTGAGGWCRTGSSVYTRGIKLYSGSLYAAVGYTFTVPSASVYRSFKLYVTGRSGSRTAEIGLQDFRLGTTWVVQNFAPLRAAGPGYGPFGITVNPTGHRSGHTVRAMVAVENFGGAASFDVRSVKLVVVYGLLR